MTFVYFDLLWVHLEYSTDLDYYSLCTDWKEDDFQVTSVHCIVSHL